jgi:hypothetical protein
MILCQQRTGVDFLKNTKHMPVFALESSNDSEPTMSCSRFLPMVSVDEAVVDYYTGLTRDSLSTEAEVGRASGAGHTGSSSKRYLGACALWLAQNVHRLSDGLGISLLWQHLSGAAEEKPGSCQSGQSVMGRKLEPRMLPVGSALKYIDPRA